MNEKEMLIEQANEIKNLKLQVEAMKNLLTKEGILTHKEIDEEVSSLLKD